MEVEIKKRQWMTFIDSIKERGSYEGMKRDT